MHWPGSGPQGRPGKLATNPRLRDEVASGWKMNSHSPAQIAARLLIDFPTIRRCGCPTETIYLAIYVRGKGNLRRELHRCSAHRAGRA